MQRQHYDLVIVGSGPAGATVGRFAAATGLSVLLVDKKQELGAPIQCSGAVSRHALEEVDCALDGEFILEPIYGFGIYDQTGEQTRIDYRQLEPEEYGKGPGKKPLGFLSPFDTIAVDRPCDIACLLCEKICPVDTITHRVVKDRAAS